MSLLITRGLGPAVARVVEKEITRYRYLMPPEVEVRAVLVAKKEQRKKIEVDAKWIPSRLA